MNVRELRAKLERFDDLKEINITYDDGYCVTPVRDVYEDNLGRVVLSEAVERRVEEATS